MQQNKPHIYTECRHFRGFIENKKTLVKQTEIVAKMHCYHLVTITNKETNSESIRNPAPLPSVQSIFFSIQCCHNDDRTPSFAFVLWIDNGCYGTLVDWILAL